MFASARTRINVGLTSIFKGHKELLVGNVIGADILNVLFVIGAAAAARPLPIVEQLPGADQSFVFLYLHLPAMLVVLALFRFYIGHAIGGGGFRRWYGWPLLALYALYVVLHYVV
jgi:cation:H+ antiporter